MKNGISNVIKVSCIESKKCKLMVALVKNRAKRH